MFNNFNLIFEQSSEAAFLIRVASKRIEACNARAEELFGHAGHDMIERSIELLHATTDQFQRIARDLDVRLAWHKVLSATGIMQRRDGSRFRAHQWAMLIRDDNGAQFAVYVVADQETESSVVGANALIDELLAEIVTNQNAEDGWGLLLAHAGNYFEWDYAEAWTPLSDGPLALTGHWGRHDNNETTKLIDERRDMNFAYGEGLPGLAWKDGQEQWLIDDGTEAPQSSAGDSCIINSGLRSLLALPVYSHGRFVATLLFAATTPRPPDDELVTVMHRVCSRLAPLIVESRHQSSAGVKREGHEFAHAHPLPIWICNSESLRIWDANSAALAATGHKTVREVTSHYLSELLEGDWDHYRSESIAPTDTRPRTVNTMSLKRRKGLPESVKIRTWGVTLNGLDAAAFMAIPLRSIEKVFSGTLSDPADTTHRLQTLSGRENDVLRHVLSGRTNKQIAGELKISPRTVEVYRASMLRKLNVHSTPQLWSLLTLEG